MAGEPAGWRWIRGWLAGAAWLAGCWLHLQQRALWPWGACAALAAAGLVAALVLRRRALPLAAAVLALAFGVSGTRAAWRLADALAPELEGQDLVLTGVVAAMPRQSVIGPRFDFEVEGATLRGEAVRVPSRVSLGWYERGDAAQAEPGSGQARPPELRAGQRWRFGARLRRPHGAMNPGGFDLELWLFERGVRAGGYVRAGRDAPPPELLAAGVAHPFERARQAVRDAAFARIADPAAAGVIAALAVGDQAAIERADWDVFRATGVAHLMSISGLHVTGFAWLCAAAIGWAWKRSGALMLALPAPLAARWGGLAAAAAYALVAGWGVPAQRTVGMIAVIALVRTAGLRWPLAASLLAAAVAVTAFDPWALLQPGFWLSFAAVALLIASDPATAAPAAAAAGRGARAAGAVRAALRAQAIATVGLAPLSMVFFQQVSLVGFVANLVAIPVVTFVVTPLALAGALLPPLWVPAAAVVQALSAFLGWLASWPAAVWTAAAAPPWAVAAGLLGGAVLVLPLPWRLRLLGLPLVLPLLAPPVERPAPGRFELVAADVGQGSAVLVRTASHLLIYDAGPQYSPEADAGERVLLPLLHTRGERRVDLLVLSHRDGDHVGGAAALLAGAEVAAIASSLEPGHPLLSAPRAGSARPAPRGGSSKVAEPHLLESGSVPHTRCETGQRWEWDGVRFEILHPPAADYARALKSNAISCVLRVAGANSSALLAGDIEAAQEAALVAQNAGNAALAADMLLVPHHGSRTSSTPAFVAAVAPHWAVVQAGYRSRFGHPAPEVVERWQAAGAQLVRSDRCGAWTLAADGSTRCEREQSRRYWHHVAAP